MFFDEKTSYIGILMKIHVEQIKANDKFNGKKIRFHRFRIHENMVWTRYRKFAFHKSCFSCFGCNLTLDIGSVHEDSAGYIFCKNCYVDRNFSGKNSYMARANSASRKNSISTEFSEYEIQASDCLRCKSKVYEAEKIQVKAGLYHVYCLKCHECQKQLESTSFLEARDR